MTPSFMIPPHASETGGDLACNHLAGALELAEFFEDKPTHLFCYPSEDGMHATTWMGGMLGVLVKGKPYRDNFGGKRQSIRIIVKDGRRYSGTLFETYIRARLVKP